MSCPLQEVKRSVGLVVKAKDPSGYLSNDGSRIRMAIKEKLAICQRIAYSTNHNNMCLMNLKEKINIPISQRRMKTCVCVHPHGAHGFTA